jgi:hypothetical protein
MKIRDIALDQQAIDTFSFKKILTVTELSEILQCSQITVHRRLKEWNALTSYNKNGRYYTIRTIPEFDKHGIWQYRDIYFSRYGTLKNTIVALASKSREGMNHAELSEILGLNPKCFMARFKELPGLKKERYKNCIIYFSGNSEKYEAQKRNRFPPEGAATKLPQDAQAIIILVELIHNPGMSIPELAEGLQGKGHAIKTENIAALFTKLRISKKKQNTRL